MLTAIICLLFLSLPLLAQDRGSKEIRYRSAADNTDQPAMFYAPPSDKPVPLVVVLHSWSADYRQRLHKDIEAWCIKQDLAYIHPNFRGPNRRPEATGSELVVGDIASAVDHAKRATKIKPNAIYLVGTSGGGYTALLMAGRKPDLWAGVSAWVPITDLGAWYRECKSSKRKYAGEIAASCGGPPGTSPAVDAEYKQRSPLTHLANAKDVRIHIHAGITDGHTGSVPISHSLHAFNLLAAPKDRLTDDQIDTFTTTSVVPTALTMDIDDTSYGKKRPLFRRRSGKATLTLFDGGHELVAPAAIAVLESFVEK